MPRSTRPRRHPGHSTPELPNVAFKGKCKHPWASVRKFPVYKLVQYCPEHDGRQHISLLVDTSSRRREVSAGLVVILSSSEAGGASFRMSPETQFSTEHARKRLGFLRASCTTQRNAARWLGAQLETVDRKQSLGTILGQMMLLLKAEGVFSTSPS